MNGHLLNDVDGGQELKSNPDWHDKNWRDIH